MNSTQSLLSTNSESFFSSPIMTTYAGFFLLTVILVSIDIYQTRGGNVTIKKAAIWSNAVHLRVNGIFVLSIPL
ncbi:hypothetical protein AB6D80_11105, partial [Vibrio sp. 10N.247.310.17]